MFNGVHPRSMPIHICTYCPHGMLTWLVGYLSSWAFCRAPHGCHQRHPQVRRNGDGQACELMRASFDALVETASPTTSGPSAARY